MNITVDGYKVNYKITGDGPQTLVILQGWGTEMSLYDSISDAVNDTFRVVQFDFPGFGGSDEPREPWNVDAYADFFCDFLAALQITSASLLGHSYGGRVIIKLANRENLPFNIERIVLLDAAGIMPKRTLLQKLKVKRYKALKKFLGLKFIYALFPEVIDDWRSRQGSADYRNASPMMRQCMVMAINEDLTNLLPGIKQETLLIWGELDTATPLSDGQKMEELIPSSGLVVLPGAGHFSYLDQPATFRSVIRSYFKIGV